MFLQVCLASFIMGILALFGGFWLFKYWLRKYFKFVEMSLYLPWVIKGVVLFGKVANWGISQVLIYAGEVCLKIDMRNVRLVVDVSNLQVYGIKNGQELQGVRLIDGMQEADILHNFLKIFKLSPCVSTESVVLTETSPTKISIIKKSLLNFLSTLTLQLVHLKISNSELHITQSLPPQQKLDFSSLKNRRKSLLLLKSFSEYQFTMPKIDIGSKISSDNRQRIIIQCTKISIIGKVENKELCCVEKVKVEFEGQWVGGNEVTIWVGAEKVGFNVVVGDLVEVIKFIKQMRFDLFAKPQLQSKKSFKTAININLPILTISLTSLHEHFHDSPQTKPYLSQIQKSIITFTSTSLTNNQFSIKQISLQIESFKPHKKRYEICQIMKIPNIVFSYLRGDLQISHDQVLVVCDRLAVALIGKIFKVICYRGRFEEYDPDVYKGIYGVQSQRVPVGIIESLRRCINISRKDSKLSQVRLKQSKTVYSPKALEFQLTLNNLTHILKFPFPTYTQQNTSTQLSHELNLPSASVTYNNVKQFTVSDLRLIHSETIHEIDLSIAVENVVVWQNQQNLVDYLQGFTIFKILVGVTTDNEEQQDVKQEGSKAGSKVVSFQHIQVHFFNQKVTLGRLQLHQHHQAQLQNIQWYLTLQKSEVTLLKPKSLYRHKYGLPQPHILFWLESLSLSSPSPATNTLSIHHPTLVIPPTDISNRLQYYLQLYNRLRYHISAYFMGMTNDDFKSMRIRYKELLRSCNVWKVAILGLRVRILDGVMDQFCRGFNRGVREQFGGVNQERQIVLYLKRTMAEKYDLMDLHVKQISLDLSPIAGLKSQQQSIYSYLNMFFPSDTSQSLFSSKKPQKLRLQKVNTLALSLTLRSITLKVRDYPLQLFNLKKASLSGQYLLKKDIIGNQDGFINGVIDIGQVEVNAGLGLLSGLSQIRKVIDKLWEKVGRSEGEIVKGVVEEYDKDNPTVWHKYYNNFQWNIKIKKQAPTIFKILTSHTPYSTDHFLLIISSLKGYSSKQSSQFNLSMLELTFGNKKILNLQNLSCFIEVLLNNSKKFEIYLEVDSGEKGYIVVDQEIVEQVLTMKVFGRDWLAIYGFVEGDKVEEIDEGIIKRMGLLELATLMAQQQTNHEVSLINHTSLLRLNFTISNFTTILSTSKTSLSLTAKSFKIFALFAPDNHLFKQWKIVNSKLSCNQISIYFCEIKSKTQNYQQKLFQRNLKYFQFLRNNDNDGMNFMEKEEGVSRFMISRDMVLRFNWYVEVGKGQWGFANVSCGIGEMRFSFSKELLHRFAAINRMLEKQSPKIVKLAPKHTKTIIKPIQRLRRSIMAVIRVHRREKFIKNNIKKLKFCLKIDKLELALVTDEKMMILLTKKESVLLYNKIYDKEDEFNAYGQNHVKVLFEGVELGIAAQVKQKWLTEGKANYHPIISSEQLSFQITTSSLPSSSPKFIPPTNSCTFTDSTLTLHPQTKAMFMDIITTITQMVNPQQQKIKMHRQQNQKYSQLTTYGKNKIKEKLLWSFKDARENQKLIGSWIFKFQRVFLQLIGSEGKAFLQMKSKRTGINLIMFNNRRVQRKFRIYDLTATNLDEIGKEYEHLLEMNSTGTAIQFTQDTYELSTYSLVLWNFYHILKLEIAPIKLRLTTEFIDTFISFIFETDETLEKISKQSQSQQMQEYQKRTPDYIKYLDILGVDIEVWYRSESFIKRMEGIKLKMDAFGLKDKFYSRKQLFKKWAIFVGKQVAGQFFSLVGQKLFG